MGSSREILDVARRRGLEGRLPYAGAVTPQEAFALLQADPRIKLVDVRTKAERDWVGRVGVPESQQLPIPWLLYPSGATNPEFLGQLSSVAPKATVLLFLCRADVRSRLAAQLATQSGGFTACFDILEGFEGEQDADGHRKTVSGWCKAGLPWIGA